MAEGARLESVYTARYPGFESLSLRQPPISNLDETRAADGTEKAVCLPVGNARTYPPANDIAGQIALRDNRNASDITDGDFIDGARSLTKTRSRGANPKSYDKELTQG